MHYHDSLISKKNCGRSDTIAVFVNCCYVRTRPIVKKLRTCALILGNLRHSAQSLCSCVQIREIKFQLVVQR